MLTFSAFRTNGLHGTRAVANTNIVSPNDILVLSKNLSPVAFVVHEKVVLNQDIFISEVHMHSGRIIVPAGRHRNIVLRNNVLTSEEPGAASSVD